MNNLTHDSMLALIAAALLGTAAVAEVSLLSTSNTLSDASLTNEVKSRPDAEKEKDDNFIDRPGTEPTPHPAWIAIAPNEIHIKSVRVSGWTVLCLEDLNDSLLEIQVYGGSGRPIAAFDSTGCGVHLFLEPQFLTVVISNPTKQANSYRLHVVFSD